MDWKLNETIPQEWQQDNSGVYTLIYRTDKKSSVSKVRVDIMTTDDKPVQSFVGNPEDLRKNLMKYMAQFNISIEHASYIGAGIVKASLLSDYVQD